MVHELDEIGPHYAETLRRWRASFHEHLAEVRALGYDERFERTWDFYLAFCEAAFRTRALRDVQLDADPAVQRARCDAAGSSSCSAGARARAARRALRDPAADAGRDRGRRRLGRSLACSPCSTRVLGAGRALAAAADRDPGRGSRTPASRRSCAGGSARARTGATGSCAAAGASAGASSSPSPSSTAQALLAALLSLPCSSASFNDDRPSTPCSGRALALWVAASSLEAVADRQLAAFRGRSGQPGQDHARRPLALLAPPNYFFQRLTWVAYALIALAGAVRLDRLLRAGADPLLVLFVTGVPPAEEAVAR